MNGEKPNLRGMETVDLHELLTQRLAETAGAYDDFMAIRKGELREVLDEITSLRNSLNRYRRWNP